MIPTTTLEETAVPRTSLRMSFPRTPDVEQDEEWFELEDRRGRRRRLRIDDYASIYQTPGLYEALAYRALGCRSPEHVVRSLEEAVNEEGKRLADLRVVDLGAGNGTVAEVFRRAGTRELMGVDSLPEAARAARRDRPLAYDDYVVTDLTDEDPLAARLLRDFAPNCLVTVAGLGCGDIPPGAFVKALNLLAPGGWLVMCIEDRFLEEDDDSGFGRLVRGMVADGTIEVLVRRRYVHRRSIEGDELHHVAMVARKQRHARLPR